MIKLYQEIIGTVASSIKVTMAIEKTRHAGQRQSRDLNNYITNDEIKSGIQDAINAIAKNLMMDNINVGDDICIINHKYDPPLNIVGNIKLAGNQLQLIVITIMKKNNFFPKTGTYKLEIKRND